MEDMKSWNHKKLDDIALDMTSRAIFILEDLSVTDKEKYLQYAPQVLEMAVRYRNNFSCYQE